MSIKINTVRRVMSALTAIAFVIAGICLMAGCISIYDSGEFSRDAVANEFSKISIPVYICLALTVLGFAWDMAFTPEKARKKANISNEMMLDNLSARRDTDSLDEAKTCALKTERKKRKINNLVQAAINLISGVVFLIYALNRSNFQSDANASVINAMRVLFPCVFLSFICALIVLYLNKKSIARETAILKEAPNRKNTESTDAAIDPKGSKVIITVRTVILIFAIVMLVYGFATGGTRDVLTKAVNICTECIGLG